MRFVGIYADYRHLLRPYSLDKSLSARDAGRQRYHLRAINNLVELKARGLLHPSTSLYQKRTVSMSFVGIYADYRHLLRLYSLEKSLSAREAGRPRYHIRAIKHQIELKARGFLHQSTSLYHKRRVAMSFVGIYADYRHLLRLYSLEKSL